MNRSLVVGAVTSAALGVALWAGCGGGNGSTFTPKGSGSGDDSSGDDTTGGDDSSGEGGIGLVAPGTDAGGSGCATTVSGKIYDPAGKNPLYNVVAYIPATTPTSFRQGVTCDTCTSLFTGSPKVTAVTDATGKFTLRGVTPGKNVPLVLQVGKWRKQLTIPTVTACQDNPQADKTLRLPKNHSEGDLPNIAISTGGADTLECLLRRMGVDAAEYVGGPGGTGRIHIFHGSTRGGGGGFAGGAPDTQPAAPQSNASLWDSATDIDKYDMVILSCEGDETKNMNQQVLYDYAAKGGRIFASHFHYAWFNTGPFFTNVNPPLATWSTGANVINPVGTLPTDIITTLPSGAPFPKGVAMKSWLGTVNALQNGQLPIQYACHNADWGTANKLSQGWISVPQQKSATEYLSFNTPFGQTTEAQCGRVVYSDLHVGAAANDTGGVVPGECANADLTPQEKALEFMLFDLAACVVPDNQDVTPPPVVN